jgi:hypothetical protein
MFPRGVTLDLTWPLDVLQEKIEKIHVEEEKNTTDV